MVQKRKYTGRPVLTIRLDPARRQALVAAAGGLSVSVAELGRAMLYAELDHPRWEPIRSHLGAFQGQMGLPLDRPPLAQKRVLQARRGSKRGRRPDPPP